MTDLKRLMLLCDYLDAQLEVVGCMAAARQHFKVGNEQLSWLYLLEWEEAKDGREELWQKLMGHYMTATMLAEGEV